MYYLKLIFVPGDGLKVLLWPRLLLLTCHLALVKLWHSFLYALCISWDTLVPGTQRKPGMLFWLLSLPGAITTSVYSLDRSRITHPFPSSPLDSMAHAFSLLDTIPFQTPHGSFCLLKSQILENIHISICYGMWNLLTNHPKRFQMDLGSKTKL